MAITGSDTLDGGAGDDDWMPGKRPGQGNNTLIGGVG